MRRVCLALLALLALGPVGDHAVMALNAQAIDDNRDPRSEVIAREQTKDGERQYREIDSPQRETETRLLWSRQRSAAVRREGNQKRIDELEQADRKAPEEMGRDSKQIAWIETRANPQPAPAKVCSACQALAAAVAAFQAERNALGNEYEDLEIKIGAGRSEVDAQKRLIAAAVAEISKMTGVWTRDQQVAKIRELEAMESRLDDTASDLGSLEGRALNLGPRLATLDNELSALRGKLDDCISTCNSSTTDPPVTPIGRRSTSGTAACPTCQGLADMHAATESAVADLRQQIAEATGRTKDIGSRLDRLRREHDAAERAKRVSLEKQLLEEIRRLEGEQSFESLATLKLNRELDGRVSIADKYRQLLEECNGRCTTTNTTFTATPPPVAPGTPQNSGGSFFTEPRGILTAGVIVLGGGVLISQAGRDSSPTGSTTSTASTPTTTPPTTTPPAPTTPVTPAPPVTNPTPSPRPRRRASMSR